MRLLIASDIHGSAEYCGRLLQAYEQEGAEQLLLLGDLLYHGPRNALPAGYQTMDAAAQLNAFTGNLCCVRGNCDAEIDQMVLDFPIMADYCLLELEGRMIFATHGHLYGESDPPRRKGGFILLTGHTHIPACVDHGDYIYMNPGSISIPKGGSCHSYILYDQGLFQWKDILTGEVYKEYKL